MRKLTLLVDDDVYEGLHRVAGQGNISRFVSEKVRPYLVPPKTGKVEDVIGCLAHLIPRDKRNPTRKQLDDARSAGMREWWGAKVARERGG